MVADTWNYSGWINPKQPLLVFCVLWYTCANPSVLAFTWDLWWVGWKKQKEGMINLPLEKLYSNDVVALVTHLRSFLFKSKKSIPTQVFRSCDINFRHSNQCLKLPTKKWLATQKSLYRSNLSGHKNMRRIWKIDETKKQFEEERK